MNNKTIAKWFSMLMIMMVASISTSFAQKLTIEDFDLAPGKSAEVAINLVNGGSTVYGLQADIELPKGVSLEADPAVVDGILADETNASITSTVKGQTVSIAVYSLTGQAIQSVESLPIVTLKLVASADYVNVNKLSIKNIKFAASNDGSAEVEGETEDAEVNAGVYVYEYPATIDFAAVTPVAKGVRTYAKDVKEGETSGVQPVKYWNIAENGNARAAGVFAGSAAFLGSEAYTSSASENVLGLVALWGTKVQYTQNVILKAGNYTISIPVVNAGGTTAVAKNLFGFIAEDGTEYLAENTAFAAGASTATVAFTLAEDTYGTLSLGYVATNEGAADMPHLFVQNIKIESPTSLALALEDLNSAIAAAKTDVASYDAVRGAAVFMYADEEFKAIEEAIAAAEKSLTSEDVAAVAAATIALNEVANAFAPAVTVPEAGATYTIAQKSTGSYLSLYSTDEADGVRLSAEAAEFSWIATEGGYYLSNAEGLYAGLLSTNKWTMSAKPETKAVISVTPVKIADAVYYTLGEANGLIGTEAGATECLANMEQNDNSLWAIVKVVEPEFEGFATGKYYFKNVESGKYLGPGNAYGSQASLMKNPEFNELEVNADGTYNLKSQVYYSGGGSYFNGDYMDGGSALPLTISKAGDYFTISSGASYFGYDGETTVLAKNLAADAKGALWSIMTEAEMKATLDAAAEANPVNATFFIHDPNFTRGNRFNSVWNVSSDCSNKNLSGGEQTNMCAESYHSTFTISQTIANAPKGVYKLTVQGFYRQDGSDNDNLPVFFLNDASSVFPTKTGTENSMSDASKSFTEGKYAATPVFFDLEADGELTLGTKLLNNKTLWCIWDNFELTYYGPDAEIGAIMFKDLYEEVAALRASAKKLMADTELREENRFNLGAALDETATIENTEEAYNNAVKTLTDAVNAAKALSIAKPVLEAMKELVDATNVYTAEAYEEYYGKWVAKYEAGTLTYDEAQALQNPSLGTGWHAQITVDNFLLSAWDAVAEAWTPYYINTWSVEGDNDGSNFRVPFFEYWTGDDNSLGARTLTATVEGVEPGKYVVSALTRVRTKNGVAGAEVSPAYGITLTANDAEPVSATDGIYYSFNNGASNFYVKEVKVPAVVGEDGVLTIKYEVAADNNISWLSFKNVKYTQVEKTYTIDVERYPGLGYGVTTVTADLTEALAFLGVEAATTDMLSIVNPDGTEISEYATYDGWFAADGSAMTWGADSKVCVKFFQALSNSQFQICDMNGADKVGTTYTFKWALKANDKTALYTINVKFVEKPFIYLADYTAKAETTVLKIAAQDAEGNWAAESATEAIAIADITALVGENYVVYGVGAKDGDKETITNQYSCDPHPGFWCLADGTADVWANSTFGVSFYATEGVFKTWTKAAVTEDLSTTFYFVNEETKEYVAYEVVLCAPVAEPEPEIGTVIQTIDYTELTSYPYYRMDGPEGTSFDVKDGALVIENNAERTNPWDLQPFIIDWFNLKAGYDYIVRITMKADADGSAQLNLGTWSAAMYNQLAFTASDECKTYSVEFPASTVESSGNDVHVLFQCGKFVGKVEIAKVEIIEIDPAVAIEDIEIATPAAPANGKYMIDGKIIIVKNGVKYNVNGSIIK